MHAQPGPAETHPSPFRPPAPPRAGLVSHRRAHPHSRASARFARSAGAAGLRACPEPIRALRLHTEQGCGMRRSESVGGRRAAPPAAVRDGPVGRPVPRRVPARQRGRVAGREHAGGVSARSDRPDATFGHGDHAALLGGT
eukprot:scaffold16504_cov105-Isochrysis_galbana.AAC.1